MSAPHERDPQPPRAEAPPGPAVPEPGAPELGDAPAPAAVPDEESADVADGAEVEP